MAEEIESYIVVPAQKRLADEVSEKDRILANKRPRVSLTKPQGQLPKMSWNTSAKSRIRTMLGRDRLLQRRSTPPVPAVAFTDPTSDIEKIRRSPAASISSEEGEVHSTTHHTTPPHEVLEVSSESDASDPDVVLNLVISEQSALSQGDVEAGSSSRDEGEVDSEDFVEVAPLDNDIHMNMDGPGDSDQDGLLQRNNKAEEDEQDPMMEYSKSRLNADPALLDASSPRTLADLSIPDLEEQLRYFYVAKDPKYIALSDPARCLVCAKDGHVLSSCEALVCQSCQIVRDHFTKDCPKIRKCRKCRGVGHDMLSCPYKLPRLIASELLCDLCQRTGHVESDCELCWRTSGRPWASNIPVASVSLHCYECGQSGHLGNDCPTRNPRKQFGSSTWSLGGRPITGRLSHYSNQGMSIKGRAQRSDQMADDSDDDQDFIHPRVAPTANRGKITIPRARGGRRVESDHYPGPRRNGSSGYSAYQPPLPKERPPPRKAERRGPQGSDVYRPMPSAAQNAWKKRRT